MPWPVVADLSGSIWTAYKCEMWPTRDLVNANGNVVMRVGGETGNRELEERIRTLLMAANPEVAKVPADPPQNDFAPPCGVTTQEAYVGDFQGSGHGALENSQGYRDESVTDYRADREPSDGRVMFSGKWLTNRDGFASAGKQDEAMQRQQKF